jgi:hypothetical protein
MVETSLNISEYENNIGRDFPQPEQFLYDVTKDGIRGFSYAVPDPNGLYLDEEYAATTRWGGLIAPPGYHYAFGSPAWLGKVPGIRDANGVELSNADNATESWEFYAPMRPGDSILSYGKIASATPKVSRKLGECVLVGEEMRYTNQKGKIIARLMSYSFRFNGKEAAEGGKVATSYPPMPEGQFTRNISTPPALPGTFKVPARRYDAPRFFEDVQVGDEITPWEHPKLMVGHMARFNATTAGTGYDRIGRMGHIPDAFAPGVLRIHWFASTILRWAGPDAFVTKIAQRNEEWVLVGFGLTFGGTVTGKSVVDGRCLVDLSVWCRSELGFQTNSGTAQVEMISRDAKPLSREGLTPF